MGAVGSVGGGFGTERLEMLPLEAGHAEPMAAVLGDPALHRYIGGAPETPAGLRARYERLVAGAPEPGVTWLNWVIRLRAEGRLAGTVQATVRDGGAGGGLGSGPGVAPGAASYAEVAWVVGTLWQGRGIAKEAARGLVRHLAAHHVRTVLAHVHPDHAASAAVATAAGLAPTGELHDGEVRWRADLLPPGR